MNLLNIKAHFQPAKCDLKMFCEDVYGLMQKIIPTSSFGVLILKNNKIVHLNNDKFCINVIFPVNNRNRY